MVVVMVTITNVVLVMVLCRKAGGSYGFTASISEDDQRLVVGNPVQRNYIWVKLC